MLSFIIISETMCSLVMQALPSYILVTLVKCNALKCQYYSCLHTFMVCITHEERERGQEDSVCIISDACTYIYGMYNTLKRQREDRGIVCV